MTSGTSVKSVYRYRADGEKLGVKGSDGHGYDYRGSFLYARNGSSLTLSGAYFGEGFISTGSNGSMPYYHLKDHLGSIRVVLDSAGTVRERNDYYPFGTPHLRGTEYPLLSSNLLKYNGKEEQLIGGSGYLDYGARMYDAKLGRWISADPLSEEYYGMSPYAYCVNNPVNRIDPDGRDSYLLVWFSGDNETGHAGIAVDNYKQKQIMDSKGKPVLDSKGKFTYEMVKDGTMTYHDLWPNNPVRKTELQSDVKSDYSRGIIINSLSDLTIKDPTGSRSGNVSAEGRAADGIVQIGTTYAQDAKIQGYVSSTASSDKAYNASSFNCSTFAENALKTVFPTLDASQYVKVPFPLNVMYENIRVIAPNNLYNATMELPNATNIKGPKSVVAKPYLEYYGK